MSSNTTESLNTPSATMLLSSSCAHCPGVLDALSKMIKAGDIASLTVINLEQTPDALELYNVRSVPWVKIGQHELTGSQTLEALKQRAEWAKDENNNETKVIADFDFLLSDGQVDVVIEKLKKNPDTFSAIMTLLSDSGTVLSSRIGIGVVVEEFAGSSLIKKHIDQLGKLSKHNDSRIRADAFHYLGFTADKSARPLLKAGLDDKSNNNEIKEIISDSLNELNDV